MFNCNHNLIFMFFFLFILNNLKLKYSYWLIRTQPFTHSIETDYTNIFWMIFELRIKLETKSRTLATENVNQQKASFQSVECTLKTIFYVQLCAWLVKFVISHDKLIRSISVGMVKFVVSFVCRSLRLCMCVCKTERERESVVLVCKWLARARRTRSWCIINSVNARCAFRCM